MPNNKTCPSCGAVVGNATKKCKGLNNDGSCGYDWAAVKAASQFPDDGRRASRRGQGKKAENEGIQQKPKADLRSDEARARGREAARASAARRAATLVTCCGDGGCGETKRADEFSWSELQKKAPRCMVCVASDTVEVPFGVPIRAADGTDMASIEVSDDANERRWKVVAIGTVDKVKDELEAATRDRALQTLRDAIGRNGTAWANVVRVDDAPTDYSIRVYFNEDDAGFYATETVVRRSLAATEGGTRAQPQPDGTRERRFNTEGCDFEKVARDLFDPARSRLAFAATMRHVRGDTPEPGDGDFCLFARKASFPSGFNEELPNMNDDIFIVQGLVPAPGMKCWNFYGSTAEEALKNCLQQAKCNVVAQLYLTDEALFAQIAARSVEKLAYLDLGEEVYTEDLLPNVKSARAGLPFDVAVKDKDTNWKRRRLLGASMAAAGVQYVRGDGGGFVYRTMGPNPRDFLNRKDAMEYALEDSPTLMRLELDARHKLAWLEELDEEIVASGVELSEAVASRRDSASRRTGDVPTHLLVSTQASEKRKKRPKAGSAGSNSGEPWEDCLTSIAAFTKVLGCLGTRSDVVLVACNEVQLREMHVGLALDTGEAYPEAAALYHRAASSVGCLDKFDQEALLDVFDQIATKEGYKMDLLQRAYGSKLNAKQLSFLEDEFVFAATFPHDYAPIEAIRLMPKPLAKFTKAFPGYWTLKDCAWNRFCFNMALVRFNSAVEEAETRKEYEAEMGL